MIFTKDKITVKLYDSRKEMGEIAASDTAAKIEELLLVKDEINIIFAAAPSQNEFLASLVKENRIDWSRINAFHMDEYIGLEEDAPQRFGHFLKESIFGKVPFKQVNYINGKALPSEECARYEALLKQYPADIVCLGIGENGHIAFNDPHVADFKDPQAVKIVDLDQACRQQQVNDGCFQSINEVPTHAYTLSIPALLSANHMYCIVPGESKANAVYHTLYGEISITCPASVLRTKDNVTLYLDANSASLIETKTF